MKINFAQADHLDVDNFGDDTLFGPDACGNFYYNQLEFGTNPGGTEEVAIHDTCNRYMPIALESIPDLIAALNHVLEMHNTMKQAEALQDRVFDNVQAYVDYEEVQYDTDEPVQDFTFWNSQR